MDFKMNSLVISIIFVLGVELLVVVQSGDNIVEVAFQKPTKQSSSHNAGVSSNAVDGIKLQSYFGGKSCTHTIDGSKNWWMVDLERSYVVYTIGLLNRNDCCAERLQNFFIYVSVVDPLPIPPSDSSFAGLLCIHQESIVSTNGMQYFNCTRPIRGRYVYVWKPANGDLSLCEFQVMAKRDRYDHGCNVIKGQKISGNATYGETLKMPTLLYCVTVCENVEHVLVTHGQLNTKTGQCECFGYTGMNGDVPSISPNHDYEHCELEF